MVKVRVSASVSTDVYGSTNVASVSLEVNEPGVPTSSAGALSTVAAVEQVRDALHARLTQARKELDAQLDVAAENAAKAERERRKAEVEKADGAPDRDSSVPF